jgi:SAM-dependent methyltransferase
MTGMVSAMSRTGSDELLRRIAAVPIWYHTMELASGVETPGCFDMRPFVPEFRFPTSMAGLRVVDVGTSNGQFAFHFERLGAAHVVAIDLAHVLDHDFPHWYREELRGKHTAVELDRIDHDELEAGFALAHEVYRSRVEKRRCTVYEIGDRMPGEFDLAYCCNLVQHLSDPVRALESIRRSLQPGGRFIFGCSCDISVDAVSYGIFHGAIDPHITYWAPSREAAVRMCRLAGFVDVEWLGSFRFAPIPHPDRVGTLGVLHARNRA